MPIDPNIAMGYRAPQLESPVNQMAAGMQLQGAQQANELNRQKMEEYKRAREMEGVRRNALAGIDFNAPDSFNKVAQRLFEIGDLKTADEMLKARDERDYKQAQTGKEKALTGKAETETKVEKLKFFKDHATILANNPNDQAIQLFATSAVNSGAMDFVTANAALKDLLSLAPAQRSEKLMRLALGADKALKQHYVTQNLGGTERVIAMPEYGTGASSVVQGSEAKTTLTPFQQGSLGLQKRRLDEEMATGTPLTKDTLDFAAQMYIQTGQMPQVGMGKAAQALRSQILTRAAEIKMGGGVSAADAATNVVGNKIDVATKTKASKDFSTGTLGNKVTAFNTAIDHLSTMDKLSDALQNGDIKLINSLGNIIARQTGQPAPTNFDAAKQIVTAEVIKAVVASGGGVTERQEAERNFAAANSPAQLKGLIKTYKQLLGGQLNSLGLQYETTTGKKDFESKLTGDAKTEFKTIRGEHTSAGAVDTNNKWLK